MRYNQGIEVAENWVEFRDMLNFKPKTVYKKHTGYRGAGYLDITSTFDIETTNTDTDGFAYSWQTCVNGRVVLPRYFEDWLDILNHLADLWHLELGKRHMVVYVHNLGYEFNYVAQLLNECWGIDKALYTESRKPLYIKFCNGIEFRDSFKLFQKSLARATEGCKHEKLVGDLDYTIYRTPDTELTEREFGYCVNDVLGLFEAIERLKKEHGYNQATIPYTNTGMVIEAVNKNLDSKCKQAMEKLQLNRNQMLIAYKAMAGGDTHGTRWRAGWTYTNCNSYDFKSAHPSQQLLWKFPKGAPIDLPEWTKRADFEGIIKAGFGWVGLICLKDVTVKPECPDPVISVSKCSDAMGLGELDNGRVLSADSLSVWCDSNDWQRIREAYDFDGAIMAKGFCFALDYLPDSFRKTILEYFRIKETMKGSPDYMFSKICVNTIFGACAQKTIRNEHTVQFTKDGMIPQNIKWEQVLSTKSEKEIKKTQAHKFPFLWGLWTSSLTRLCLWEMLKTVGWENVIYWDTDSCKFQGKKCPEIEQYNAKIRKQCEDRGVVVTRKDGKKIYIGVAEDEHPQADYGMKEFRFLHAKCYADRDCDGKLESTIAGVGKRNGLLALGARPTIYADRIELVGGDIEKLNNWLTIPNAGGFQLAYHDSPIVIRHDFARPTRSASWVVMKPRRYDMPEFKRMIEHGALEEIRLA